MAERIVPEALYESVKDYKRRFYLNLLLKGGILFLGLGIGYFTLISTLEYFGWFGSSVRAVFLFSFLLVVAAAAFLFLFRPLYYFLNAEKIISDEKAASELGALFPDVKDKLLNMLQLRNAPEQNSLVAASILQKSGELAGVPFHTAVDYRANKRYLPYLIPVLLLAAAGASLLPGLFTDSPKRIVSYNQYFSKPAPFTFQIKNPSLSAFRNENFTLQCHVSGKELPDKITLVANGELHPMERSAPDTYEFVFSALQQEVQFQFEGAGFYSEMHTLHLLNKPLIGQINARFHYPAYIGRKNEAQQNIGNLTVPEGTKIDWEISTYHTNRIRLVLGTQPASVLQAGLLKEGFQFSARATKTFDYRLKLLNEEAEGDGELQYTVQVTPDARPRVQVLPARDSVLFRYVLIAGNMADDYGFSALSLFYKVNRKAAQGQYRQLSIPFVKGNTAQNFYFNWTIDSLHLRPGDKLEYYVKVWDNDGVNGPKAASSQAFALELPTEKSISEEIRHQQSETAQNLSKSHTQSKSISKQLDKLQNSFKNKKELNWQDRKNIEDLLQKQNELKSKLESLQQQNEQSNEKEEKFQQLNEQLAEKSAQLQELMKDILDDETLKLYEELQKLLEEKNNTPQIKDLLEKLDNKQERFDKELERALEMFKQLKFEKELDKAIQQADKQSKEQEQLSEKTPDGKQSPENLKNEQQQQNEKFDELKKELTNLEELNKSMEQKNEFDPEDATQKSISEKQQKSTEQLQKGNRKEAQKQQKSAADQMKDLKERLQAAQQNMQQEEVDENVQDLRYLLENLLALSFEQETLMKEFKKINQTDPRYIGLLQREVKLKEDAKLIEDSLFALGKRVFQLRKFVTEEVGHMNDYIGESIASLKQRRPDISSGKQQFAMTSMNNLALMLSEVLKQLQQQQQQMKSKPGSGQCKKPGKNKPGQSMSEMQKALNKRIEALKGSGKQGKELSQELARMIAEQQTIRKMVKDAESKGSMDPNGKQQLKELAKKMEETEKELAFKQLSQQTIMRQNDIATRLLESEKASRERELEENRESKSGQQDLKNQYPPALEKYLKEKERQIELLKSTQPGLNPYYKEKVGQYFQKISE